MTLEGAINFNETNDYIIYTMNSAATGQYGVVLPKNISNTLNMLIDLHMKISFDSVGSGAMTKEQLIQEISGEYLKLRNKYVDGMLVMPMIDSSVYQTAVTNNDKQKMFDIEKGIAAITSELYKKLMETGVDKQKIDQKIIIVEKNGEDASFVNWLKEQMPNPSFVEGVKLEEEQQQNVNPFVPGNDIFGSVNNEVKEEVVAPVTPNSGGIFDTPAAQTVIPDTTPVTPVAPVEPVVSENVPTGIVNSEVPGGNVDIFGAPLNQIDNNVQAAPSVAPTAQSVDVFSANAASVQTPVEPVAPAQTSVEVPKPVESAPLEGTMTFSAVANPVVSDNVSNGEATSSDNNIDNKSKGFANLLILLVILVGVTLASIELGKFLYSVYGA